MILQAFVQVRLLPIDRSRDSKIKIKDFPGVQVDNWRDWQPKEGEDISNLTLEEVEVLVSSITVNDGDNIVDSRETIVVDVE